MSANDQLERGLYEFQNGNFQVASKHFTQVIEEEYPLPDQFEALKKRSACNHELRDYDQALKDAKVLIDVCPNDTSGYALCGNTLTKLEKYEDALAIFRKGLEIDANDLEIKNGLKNMQTEIMASFEKHGTSESTYNAVKMSSQEPYPGDNELEVLEREIMEKWGITKFPDVEMGIQNPSVAVKDYEAALLYRKAGNDELALEKLRSALSHDAANFTLRGELALLLHEMDKNREAYQQCNSIPPDFRKAKYWKVGGKALDALKLPVHAESWLRHGTRLDKNDTEMPLLFQNIRVRRLYGPLTEGTKAKVTFTQYGRAVEAAEDIEDGENCFRDKPAVLAQTLDTLHVPACSHCAKNLMRPDDYFDKELLSSNAELRKVIQRYWPIRPRVECKECGSKTIYCSTECRDESWASYHQILCVKANPACLKLDEVCQQYTNLSNDSRCWKGVWNASFSPYVLARIWASIICMAKNIATQEGRAVPSAADWAMAKSPFRKFIAYGSSSNANVIPKMVTLMQEVFDNESLPEGMKYKITQKEFDGRYFQSTCNVQAFSDPSPPFNIFMNNVGKDPKLRELVRLHTMKDPEDAMFAGMFPLHACLNHSCDNNVEVLDGHPGVLVRARRPIKKGEELFTTYINTRMPRRERRAWLYRGYNFWCHCPRCKFEGDGPEKCTQCGKEAKEDGKEKYPGCGKCHRAWYCSTVCQKTAWKKGHKRICSTPHSFTYSSADYYMENVAGNFF